MIGNVCIMHNVSLKLRLLGVGHVVIRLLPQAQEKKFEKFFIAKHESGQKQSSRRRLGTKKSIIRKSEGTWPIYTSWPKQFGVRIYNAKYK